MNAFFIVSVFTLNAAQIQPGFGSFVHFIAGGRKQDEIDAAKAEAGGERSDVELL